MTGLEKIISEIVQESEKEAKEILDAAHAEAKRISESAKSKSEAVTREINEASTQNIKDIATGFETTLDIQRRRMALVKKQSIISETLQKAKEAIYKLPDGEYFDLLTKLAVKSAHNGEGTALINEQDTQRLPSDFEAKLNSCLPKGSSLKISEETLKIDGGLVLRYGDIVENCSIEAVFSARADEFSDIVRRVLFDD